MSEPTAAYPINSGVEIDYTIDESRLVSDSDVPKAVGWRIIVQPLPVMRRTKTGLFLPDQAVKANELLTYVGKVLAMGPHCYEHEKFGGGEPWCKVGDYVLFGQYQGQKISIQLEGDEKADLVILNDDEIRAVTDVPEKFRAYV